LGISGEEDSVLAEFAKPNSDVLTLERIAEYERLIAEAQVARVRHATRRHCELHFFF
jgi:succinate dehydrogenase flavin-adding protein (antitoxin of CptAB toxin-antitoxin module)